MITTLEILLFVRQASIALAGASALWGLYFYWVASNSESKKKEVLTRVSHKMIEPLSVATFVFSISWFVLDAFLSYGVRAHEGITLDPTTSQYIAGLQVTEPFVIALIVTFIAGLILRAANRKRFTENITLFYGTQLALATIIISLPVWTGRVDPDKIFYIGHNVHSIITLGTVLVLDFIMLLANYHDEFKIYLYPQLPAISKVIWLGLFLDFVSVAFVFETALEWTNQFFFMQTVIGILIINGILLSGPITQKLIETVKGGKVRAMPKKWNTIATISGCLSISSWVTITFTDFLKEVDTVSYTTFISVFIGFVLLSYIVYESLEHYKVGSHW